MVDPAGHTYPGLHTASQDGEFAPGEAPYRPAEQLVHDTAAARLYCPGGHVNWVVDADPAGQKYPAVHVPVHTDDVNAAMAPNLPPGHGSHTPAPARLYEPGWHWTAVADVLPAGHAYPAMQFPLHADVSSPDAEPKVPAGQAAVHADVFIAAVAPYRPATHALHVDAPELLNCPKGHTDAVPLVDPAGHAYPAVQSPLHADVFIAGVAPYSPAAHAVHGFISPN